MKILILGLLSLFSSIAGRYEMPSLEKDVVQIDSGCSGFIGFPGVVITAAHCVRGSATHSVTFYDGVREDFRVIAKGKEDSTDWALLYGNTRGLTPVRFSERTAQTNSPCKIIGHGGGNPRQLGTYCFVEAPDPEWAGYINLAATTIPGDSGSAVRTENGEVFGIAVRSAMPFPVGLAVPIGLARKAYATWLKQQK